MSAETDSPQSLLPIVKSETVAGMISATSTAKGADCIMSTHLQTDQPGRAESRQLQYSNPDQTCSPPSPLANAAPPKPIRIVVLEDLPELAELDSEYLTFKGFEMDADHDGASAFQFLGSRTFHVALVDIDLPDISGFEVVTRARTTGCLCDTRIVFSYGPANCPHIPRGVPLPDRTLYILRTATHAPAFGGHTLYGGICPAVWQTDTDEYLLLRRQDGLKEAQKRRDQGRGREVIQRCVHRRRADERNQQRHSAIHEYGALLFVRPSGGRDRLSSISPQLRNHLLKQS